MTGSSVALNADDVGRVSLSFGSPEVIGPTAAAKNVQVVNKGGAVQTYILTYHGITDMPGVTFTLPVSTVTAPAGGIATFPLAMAADPAAMQRVRDAHGGSSHRPCHVTG